MGDVATPLAGAQSTGPGASVAEMPPQGMITLRGDLADPDLAEAVHRVTGCALPERRAIVHGKDSAVAWMSPDELLLLLPHGSGGTTVAALDETLAGRHYLAVDVSDARAMFRIDGAGVREVLARLCPADLSPAAFGEGEIRRTRMGQVPAAFWIAPQGGWRVVCFRSVARYAFDLLAGAIASPAIGVIDDR